MSQGSPTSESAAVDDQPSNEDESSHENQPLLPHMETMRHEASVYSFMFFQPELSRQLHGHYWTAPVILAFILLFLNMTMQLGLSYMAGAVINQRHDLFRSTLVLHGDHSALHRELSVTPLAWIGGHNSAIWRSLKQAIAGKEFTDDTCCNAAECFHSELRCCDRTGATPHSPLERPILGKHKLEFPIDAAPAPAPAAASVHTQEGKETVLSFLTKPGSSGGKKGKDGENDFPSSTDLSAAFRGHDAICYSANGTMDCAPKSLSFMDSWFELDKDGDGLWTLDEARADEANFGCKFGISVEEVFRSVSRGVVFDAQDTAANSYAVPSIPFSVEQRRAIPKKYFDWWRGLTAICIVSDTARCGDLVTRGIFDGVIGAADPRSHRGGVVDLDTAMEYCQRLLAPGGICEKTLPSTYMMYRSILQEKCGEAFYQLGEKHMNPYDSRDVMRIVKVSYSNVTTYSTCLSKEFLFFLSLVLFLWYTNLIGEAQGIVKLADFLWNFPINEEAANPLVTPKVLQLFNRIGFGQLVKNMPEEVEDFERKQTGAHYHRRVVSITRVHKLTCWVMFGVRLWLLVFMFEVGSVYLVYTQNYMDLLLNSVALGCIFEFPCFLYHMLVNSSIKEGVDGATTAPYRSGLPTSGWRRAILSKSFFSIILLPCCVVLQVVWNRHINILPTVEALSCACFQEGDHCVASRFFERGWWDRYWVKFARIDSSHVP